MVTDEHARRASHWGKILLATVVILAAMFTIVEAVAASVNGDMSESLFYLGVTVVIMAGAGFPTIILLESELNAE